MVHWKKLFIIMLIFIGIGLMMPVFATEDISTSLSNAVLPSELGQVHGVETFGDVKYSPSGELSQVKQMVEVKILTGRHKGEKVLINNILMGNPAYDINLKKGDKLILHAEQADGGLNFDIADKYRVDGLYFFIGLFFVLLVIVGGRKGFFSLISILTTLGLVFWVLAPLALIGFNIILATIFVCILASIIAIYIVGGLNSKSTSAILGTILSLIIAVFLSIMSIKLTSLTGFSSEQYLYLFAAHPNLNFLWVLASAMIIGALGAVMDIGMSISSTVNELFLSNPEMSVKDLFTSGMNVGKDIIGMMSNTLILAYLGGSIALVFLSGNIDLQKFFNLNQVATEISTALVGSITIVLCVPITAIIAAYLIKKFPQRVAENDFNGIIEE